LHDTPVAGAYQDDTTDTDREADARNPGGDPMRKKAGEDAPVVKMLSPCEIEALKIYRAADGRTKAAMTRLAKRMAVEKMPIEIAGELYKLEIAGADPNYIAAWRRRRLRSLRSRTALEL
jgi:hypothetical protein